MVLGTKLHGSLRGRSDRHTGRRDFLCEQVSGDKGHCEQKTSKERFHEGIWKLLVHLNKGSQCFLLQKSCAPCNLIYKNLSVANPRGDAYSPSEALLVDEALKFHAWQAGKLADTGADFLLAATLPALSEATGLALALAATGKPYLLSFVVRREGTLLDGTPLKDAIAAIDSAVTPPPLAYLINCTHVSFTRSALMHGANSSALDRQRIIGLLANTAALSPEDLNDSTSLVEEEPETFGQSVAGLHRELGLKILGGCCGTDDRHIHSLAAQLAAGVQADISGGSVQT